MVESFLSNEILKQWTVGNVNISFFLSFSKSHTDEELKKNVMISKNITKKNKYHISTYICICMCKTFKKLFPEL